MTDWISVKDKLPGEESTVLVFSSMSSIYTCRKSVIFRMNAEQEPTVGQRERITHWMPLPEPPK